MNIFSSGDPRYKSLEQASKKYTDPFESMSREELTHYQGKVVAILDETGEIIAEALTRQELVKAVKNSGRASEAWSYRDVPQLNPMT